VLQLERRQGVHDHHRAVHLVATTTTENGVTPPNFEWLLSVSLSLRALSLSLSLSLDIYIYIYIYIPTDTYQRAYQLGPIISPRGGCI
jgi:hypothetical protein